MPTIDWVWYSWKDVATAPGTTVFFDESEPAVGRTATNMKMAGQLPSGESFLIKSIQVFIDPVEDYTDAQKLLTKSVVMLEIGEERKFIAPTAFFTPQGSLAGSVCAGGLTTGVPIDLHGRAGAVYELARPIELAGGVGFKAELETTQTLSATTGVYVCLVGERTY